MENITYINLSRQMTLRHQVDVAANNVANVNTTGYKKESLRFRDFVYNTQFGNQHHVSFVDDYMRFRDLSEGEIESTGNTFDLALSGKGYFQVDAGFERGLQYTRHGRFQINESGVLTTSDNLPVLDPGGSPILIPLNEGKIEISADGTISSELGEITKIGVYKFSDEHQLTRTANNLYSSENELPKLSENPNVLQGYLEGSNVNAVGEITALIKAQHTNTALSRMVQKDADRQKEAVNKLSGNNRG